MKNDELGKLFFDGEKTDEEVQAMIGGYSGVGDTAGRQAYDIIRAYVGMKAPGEETHRLFKRWFAHDESLVKDRAFRDLFFDTSVFECNG